MILDIKTLCKNADYHLNNKEPAVKISASGDVFFVYVSEYFEMNQAM